MRIDRNEFFREASLLICSSLDFCQALGKARKYLMTIMPLEHLHLNIYLEKSREAWTYTCSTNLDMCEKHVFTPANNPRIQQCLERYAELNRKGVLRYASSEDSPLGSVVALLLDCPGRSIIVIHLNIGDQYLGSVVAVAREGHLFTELHAELLERLNEPFGIAVCNALSYEQLNRSKEQLAADNRYLNDELRRVSRVEVIGSEGGLKQIMEMVDQIAQLNNTVLILGETGVGKEVIANAIHQASYRRNGPLIKVNCGAIPESLIDSELFGHEKGAFTGAISRKPGRFERAQGGTIMLDEIGELPESAQVRLLRVLQYKEIERVGGTESIPVDLRVIAATHKNLEKMVREGRFRQDLWFRLNIFPIEIPPLRQRRGDILPLVQHFMQCKAEEMGMRSAPPMADGALQKLLAYDWPGNVRELENVVERAMIKNRGQMIPLDPFAASPALLSQASNPCEQEERLFNCPGGEHCEGIRSLENGRFLSLDEMVAQQIEKALDLTNGKINGAGGAAEILKVHPSTLRHKMEKLGITYGRGRTN